MFNFIKKISGDFWSDYLAYLFKLGYLRFEIILSFSLLSFLTVFLPLAASYFSVRLFDRHIPANLTVNVTVLLLCILLTVVWIFTGLSKSYKQAGFKHGK
jgi:ABC-type bacteriocin/lantibiotic exporter with double-glycine peptidase domain